MAYKYAKKITVNNNCEAKPDYLKWCKARPAYLVRSDAGGLSTRLDDCETLGEARKIARAHAKSKGWAEIFRWAENATTLKKLHIATYDREITA